MTSPHATADWSTKLPPPHATTRVLVAMSGGVDSSVAAALLHEQGYSLIGVTLHLWDASGEQQIGRCCAPEDRDDARKTCELLGIPHYVLDQREAFREHVVNPFIEEYQTGRTPVPCVHCNRTVKLVHLADIADRFGCSHIATGHYARVMRPDGLAGCSGVDANSDGSHGDDSNRPVRLLRGLDQGKDQSYFLFGLPQHVLKRMVFPLGELQKDDAREHARRLGLHNANKPDSQELCFVPSGDVGGFVDSQERARTPGRIVDTEGNALADHNGIESFTVGQRRGLGLGGGSPRYVLRIVPESHEVVVGDPDSLMTHTLSAVQAQWLTPTNAMGEDFEAMVKIRYRHRGAPARVRPTSDGFDVTFAEPQRAVTPGQAAVVYAGDEVVGGGFIA